MLKRLVITLLLIVATASAAMATQPAWEANPNGKAMQSIERSDNDQIEIYVRDGYVYINTPHAVNVKIFSILGQLISQQEIPAGNFRLRIASRGIYILKAGSITRRITI